MEIYGLFDCIAVGFRYDNHQNPVMAETKKRVLIVKLSSLGDLLHALPAAHCLKRGLPAEIDWIVHPVYEELAKCFADVSRVLVFPRRAAPAEFRRRINVLRLEQYDLIIDLQGILKSALVSRLARGRKRLGPSFWREGAALFYHAVAGPKNKNRHAVDEIMDCVRYLNLPLRPPVFPLRVPLQLVGEAAPRVALLPFSRWPSKNWPLPSFARVGRELREQANAALFILGSAGEEKPAAELEKELAGRVINLAGKTSLPQMAGLLREMDLVISGDSGPLHLAAACGTPALALYGPTDPRRTGPCGARGRVLQGKLRCQPCFAVRCRYGDNSCLLTITPEMVINAALAMLAHNGPR